MSYHNTTSAPTTTASPTTTTAAPTTTTTAAPSGTTTTAAPTTTTTTAAPTSPSGESYNITVDTQFRFSGTDASGTFTDAEYPTISGTLGDSFIFNLFQSEAYALSIEGSYEVDFYNKYDTSAGATGTKETFTPSEAGTYDYYNNVDFDTFGSLIVSSPPTTTTTTQAPTTTAAPTTTTPAHLPSGQIFNVTVVNVAGKNRYFLNGVRDEYITLEQDKTYRFDQSDSSNTNHPLRFSATEDGTHGGGASYPSGVIINGIPGQSGAYSQITIPSG